MDQSHKTWLWKKRSSEKTIVATDRLDISFKGYEEPMVPTEKEVDLERSLKILNEKLSSVLCECNTKDELLATHEKMAQAAVAGQEKAEAEIVNLKQELDEASQQRIAANERLAHLNAALKEYMRQLSSIREGQEQRIHDAVMETSRELEKSQRKLEEKYKETTKRLANLTVENAQLSKALIVKEKVVEDLSRRKSQVEAEFNMLMTRLDSIEKENAFLKYEFRMLENELEIRNEELEFNRRSADASNRQHMESVKKVTKLEAECQRLRVLVRKRLPGPVALAKMKGEVEIQGRNQMELRRRKLNHLTGGLVVRDLTKENPLEIPNKKISYLIGRLCDVEEENKILKEILAKKDDELQTSRSTSALTASKLSQVESQIEGLSKIQISMELARCNDCSPMSNELSLTSSFDICNDNETIGSQSRASTECKTVGVSDMSLMDDFVEMEKLAMVSVENPFGSSYISSETGHALSDSKASSGYHLDIIGKELVPVGQVDHVDMEMDIQRSDMSSGGTSDWLQRVLKVILDQSRISKRCFSELLEDIRIALNCVGPSSDKALEAKSSKHSGASGSLPISGYITWKSPNSSPRVNTCTGLSDMDMMVEISSNEHVDFNLSKSICKVIDLVKEIDPISSRDGNTDNGLGRDHASELNKNSASPTEYSFHVFRCRTSELSSVLQNFVVTCNNVMNQKANLENFVVELASVLGWIINNCIAFQHVSGITDKVQKHFGLDKSVNAYESKEHSSCLSLDAWSHGQNITFQIEKVWTKLQEENTGLKNELKNRESAQKDLEARLKSANDNSEASINQLQEAEQIIGSLKAEVENLKESKGMIEDQIENQNLINEDLSTQLTVAKVKVNEVLQRLSSLEVELEDKGHCCEELETTCLELQLQLESVTNKETSKDNIHQEEKLLQTGWEIRAASAKLAECQETIFSLGKQLKALSSSKEATVLEKVFPTNTNTTNKNSNNKILSQRPSLRDRMLAEDGAAAEDTKSLKLKIVSPEEAQKPSVQQFKNCDTISAPSALSPPPEACLGWRYDNKTAMAGPLAIVPSKKRGGIGLLKKLLLRRKKSSKKTSFSFVK